MAILAPGPVRGLSGQPLWLERGRPEFLGSFLERLVLSSERKAPARS